MRAKRVVYGLCAIAVMAVIFLLSNQNYDETMETSDRIVKPIENIIKENSRKTFETEEKKNKYYKTLKGKLDVAVRKSAHTALFAIFAIFIYLWLKALGLDNYNAVIMTLVICGLYAGFDELHQHFVNKRDARFTDICIDEFGAVIVMCSIWIKNKLGDHIGRYQKS